MRGIAAFDATALDAESEASRFGYNGDYIAYMPLPKDSDNSDNGLLCVNNEYVSPNVMFEGLTEDEAGKAMSADQVALCNMAVGHSIVEVRKADGAWEIVQDSPYNRRVTLETEMAISCPCASHGAMVGGPGPRDRPPAPFRRRLPPVRRRGRCRARTRSRFGHVDPRDQRARWSGSS